MRPLISVVVPIYGVEKYLNRCIDSLLAQTLKNIEIILVDDGSKDRCPEICDEYAKRDERIKVIHKQNGGLGFARNSGLDTAEGEYLTFIDSDDFVAVDYLEKLYVGAKESNSDVCLGGMTDKYIDRIEISPSTFAGNVFDEDKTRNILLTSMLGYDYDGSGYEGMSVCKGIYRLSFLKENGIRFVSERQYISEDIIFDINLYVKAKRVCIIKEAGYFYCHNNTSLTTSYKPERYEQYKKLHKYELELAKQFELSKDHEDRISSMFLANVRVTIKQIAKHLRCKEAFKEIRKIQKDEYLQGVLKCYDYKRMPVKQKVFCIALKNKLDVAVYLMAKVQNASR